MASEAFARSVDTQRLRETWTRLLTATNATIALLQSTAVDSPAIVQIVKGELEAARTDHGNAIAALLTELRRDA